MASVLERQAADTKRYGYVRPREVYEDYVYNFAIGSNIYPPDKLKSRRTVTVEQGGGSGGGVSYESFELGTAHGWRLATNVLGMPPQEPAFAAVEPLGDGGEDAGGYHVNGWMQGALICLSRDAYNQLWDSEGGNALRGSPYCECIVQVKRQDGTEVRAVAFRGRGAFKLQHDVAVSHRYQQIIAGGAKKLGASEEYLKVLDEMHVTESMRLPVTPMVSMRSLRTAFCCFGVATRASERGGEFYSLTMVNYYRRLGWLNSKREAAASRKNLVGEVGYELAIGACSLPLVAASFVVDATFWALHRAGVCENFPQLLSQIFSDPRR